MEIEEDGDYEIAGLSPGNYELTLAYSLHRAARAGSSGGVQGSMVYESCAIPCDGKTVTTKNIAVSLHHLSGKVVDAVSGEPIEAVQAKLEPVNGSGREVLKCLSQGDGAFRFPDIGSGDYELTLACGRDLFPYLDWDAVESPERHIRETAVKNNLKYTASVSRETGVPINEAPQYLLKFLANGDYPAKRIPIRIGDGDVDVGTLTMETSKAGILLEVRAPAELDGETCNIQVYQPGDRSGRSLGVYGDKITHGSRTVLIQPLAPGTYDVILNEREGSVLAQDTLRGIEVRPDKINTLSVTLSKGVLTFLQFHPHDWDTATSLQSIWLQREKEDPVCTGDKLGVWRVRLRPGAYKFGVTFHDGRSESVEFTVDENTEGQKVDLEL
jgi:hypothetical protein